MLSESGIKTFLILFAALISLIAEFKDNMPKKRKRLSRLISVSLFIGVAIFSLKEQRNQARKENMVSLQRAREFESTIRKADTTNQKLTNALDSIGIVQKKSNLIIKSIIKQIDLEKSTLNSTKSVLSKNNKILESEAETYKQVDRILNPLFPCMIVVELEIPFNDDDTALFNYALRLKAKMESNDKYTVDNVYPWYDVKTKKITDFEFWNFDSTIAQVEKSRNPFLPQFEISLLTKPTNGKTNMANFASQFKFRVNLTGQSNESRTEVDIDLERKMFSFTLVSRHCYGTTLAGSNVNIGSSDLESCFLLFSTATGHLDYKLDDLTFESESGIPRHFEIRFNENDKLLTTKGKTYLHKMSDIIIGPLKTNDTSLHKIRKKL